MRIVMYSGGCLSWAAAMRTIERHGRDNVRLLFTDTRMEDEDLYRFLDESEKQLGVELVRIADGRNPWEVFKDRRMIGNTRHDRRHLLGALQRLRCSQYTSYRCCAVQRSCAPQS